MNEVELREENSDFSTRMRSKWCFGNESHKNSNETFEFNSRFIWNPPKGAVALELFLNQVEKDIFSLLPGKAANSKIVVIKPVDVESTVVVWARTDYLKEAEKQLSDEHSCEEIIVTGKDEFKLMERSKKLTSHLRRESVIAWFKFTKQLI